ncbi:MAG TPA: 50S ribosomal protein L10 [Solirubrobacteraceae bacterium]|nr:50S ribosomal protein L10 [Solirubrobacteraceae bacterium]
MNREQKAAAIAEIATQIDESNAIFAVDYRGISVSQAAELRSNLREADAHFKVVKNSLTERAADQVGAEALKEYLTGPTALTFVRGDIAVAAKALADYGRAIQLLPVKGGLMEGAVLDLEQIRTLSRLPSRDALYGQLVGVVASPVSGLVRTLNALISGLAVALGGVRDKKESGEIPAGEPPASEAQAAAPTAAETPAEAEAPPTEVEAPAEESAAEAEAPAEAEAEAPAQEPDADAEAPAEAESAAEQTEAEAPAEEAEAEAPAAAEAEPATEQTEAGAPAEAEAGTAPEEPEADAEAPAENQAEPEAQAPAQEDDNEADAATEVQSEDAEAKSTKED